jgi:retron-type reverse transcriptase
MFGNRKITATLAGATLEGPKVRGCPQGGVLSPLLCNLLVDELKRGSVRMAVIHWACR